MALNLDVVGSETAAFEHGYSWKDTALHALAVGAKRDGELDFLYEGRGPKVLPSYVIVPVFEVFHSMLMSVKGSLDGVVHGGQSLTFHRPLEPADRLTTVGKIDGLYDLRRLATGVFSFETRNGTGELVAEAQADVVFLKDGDFGGDKPPKKPKVDVPDRPPDFESIEKTTTEQALLYRLNSDLNPLHADPEVSGALGFDPPILHGLCTFAFVSRAVLNQACNGDPARFKSLTGQFKAPVFPGETLVVQGWTDNDRLLLRAHTQERPNDFCFANAWAEVG